MGVEELKRERIIMRASGLGILTNMGLVVMKMGLGWMAGSMVMVFDALNNLSDTLSSVVTMMGMKLAKKPPDKEHPFGHGRLEYLSATTVAVLVLFVGLMCLMASIEKMTTGRSPNYSRVTLMGLGLAVLVKLGLSGYVLRQGKKVNSGALIAAGMDALFDAVISGSILISALCLLWWQVNLEAYLGVGIALVIMGSGVRMIMEAVREILGRRVSPELTEKIKQEILEDEEVLGVYDLVLNDYGPNRYVGSVHVEVEAEMVAWKIDKMARRIRERVKEKHGVELMTIGIHARKMNRTVEKLRKRLESLVMSYVGVKEMHGFYVDFEDRKLGFDSIVDYGVKGERQRKEIFKKVIEKVQKEYRNYEIEAKLDGDVSD